VTLARRVAAPTSTSSTPAAVAPHTTRRWSPPLPAHWTVTASEDVGHGDTIEDLAGAYTWRGRAVGGGARRTSSAGWSMGGLLAYEAVRLLGEAAARPPALLLVDSPAAGRLRFRSPTGGSVVGVVRREPVDVTLAAPVPGPSALDGDDEAVTEARWPRGLLGGAGEKRPAGLAARAAGRVPPAPARPWLGLRAARRRVMVPAVLVAASLDDPARPTSGAAGLPPGHARGARGRRPLRGAGPAPGGTRWARLLTELGGEGRLRAWAEVDAGVRLI